MLSVAGNGLDLNLGIFIEYKRAIPIGDST